MTAIVRYPILPQMYGQMNKIPDEVEEWVNEQDGCEFMEDQFHYGYKVILFRDDDLVTMFRLRFPYLKKEIST
jgi:hypothetical protein